MTTPSPEPRPPQRRISEPLGESVRVLGRYIRAQLLIGIVLTVLYAIGFAVARVPLWPVIAILGGLSSFIPRVGSLVPLALAMIAELLADRNMTHFLIAFAAWLLIQALEGFFITPRLLSKPLGLKPLPVFIALLAGSFFFGPLGLFLAVPVLAIALVFWRYFNRPV
jgi:predicted PurR-regulated permease PerM